MQSYQLTHLTNAALLHDLEALAARESIATALLLAHIAEADDRKLYAPAGYPSMFAYCVDKLHLSEDAAYYRIRAARTARQFPVIFEAVAEGRLHLTAVCLLAAHLTAENAGELIEAATHRRKAEIEAFLAERFHAGEQPAMTVAVVRALPRPAPELETALIGDLLAPEQGETPHAEPAGGIQLVPARVEGAERHDQLVPARVANGGDHHELVPARVESAQRFLVRVAISKSTHDKLRHLQSLLSHSVPAGDLAQILDRALDALIAKLERRKLGVTSRARLAPGIHAAEVPASDEGLAPEELATEGPSGEGIAVGGRDRPKRYIPARIRRAVWERDQGQCTFVSSAGDRCTARSLLEFDHVQPVARGGKATVETVRLRCRAHNQYEAERVFGSAFMKRKRGESRRSSAHARSSRVR